MTLVVDASVAAKWIFNESDSDLARALRLDARRQGFELVAPEISRRKLAMSSGSESSGERLIQRRRDPFFGSSGTSAPPWSGCQALWRERWRCLFDSVIRSTTGYTWRWRGRETAYW